MRVCGDRLRMIAGGLAACLALASAGSAVAQPSTVPPAPAPSTAPPVAEPVTTSPAVIRLNQRDARDPSPRAQLWRAVWVPRGILVGIPTGASPTPPRLRPSLAPVPVGFTADPYYSPPAVAVVPPPIVVAPYFAPPFLYDVGPIAWPFDGGCFVPTDFGGQHGYVGSCGESLYQQWMSRPY
jgi:hypothetical protein